PLAIAVIASHCAGEARSSMTSPTDQFPLPISSGVIPKMMNASPFKGTSPKLPRSTCIAIANVQSPFDGRTAICPTMQGQTKSQLQVSTYRPLIFHAGDGIALPPDSSDD